MSVRGGMVLAILMFGCICDLYTANTCSNNPCRNEGRCISDGKHGYRCSCVYGWTGNNCENNVDDCYAKPCKNGGQCIDQENSRYLCNCTRYFVGNICQFPNPCLRNPCKNRARCVPLLNGKNNCICIGNFAGKYCQNRKSSCPKNINDRRKICSLHGECDYDEEGKMYCKCFDGFSGPRCEKRSPNVGCHSNYCSNGGTCTTKENGIPWCQCRDDYRGRRCEISKHVVGTQVGKTLKTTRFNTSSKNKEVCTSECINARGNSICDQLCNTPVCLFDGGDCNPWKRCTDAGVSHCRRAFHNNACNPECNNVDCLFDGQDCERSACANRDSCSVVYQNGICDPLCNNPQCGFDGGDCHGKRSDSYFSEMNIDEKCSINRKLFELDLVVLTTMENFLKNKSKFLYALGSAIKSVLTISSLTEITVNHKTALSTKLLINPTECVIYGGQCFSSLDQISNFIKAAINGHDVLSLPFEIARVDSKTIQSALSKKADLNPYFVVVMVMVLALTTSLAVIVVLLRDKWGRLRTRVKTSGTWTPSEAYSTSTSTIGSNHNCGWPVVLQSNQIKLDNVLPVQCKFETDKFVYDYLKHSQVETKNGAMPDSTSRKRRYGIFNSSDIVSSYMAISDSLLKGDGLNAHSQPKILSQIKENAQMKIEQTESASEDPCIDIGSYVNDDGESLMHIAARVNGGANVIKKLYAINSEMLHSTDEWGRTPLDTAVASDALECVEQLLLLEKQSRRETRQNRVRADFCGTLLNPVKKTTSLIEAVKLNSQEMINILLEEGSPISVLDSGGRSVVHWAAIFNNTCLLERLSSSKIFQKLVDLKDKDEKSPLYLAAHEGSFESAKFIVEYMTRVGIKIYHIYPCPKLVALEMGFGEIESLISQAQLPTVYAKNPYKKIRLKEQTMDKKLSVFNKSTMELDVINDYKEYLDDSGKLSKSSPSGDGSIDSCLFDEYSLEDSSNNNLKGIYSKDRNNSLYSQPIDKGGFSYLSNTSSSDMSPPLLSLHHPSTLNSCISSNHDNLDPALESSFFLNSNDVSTTKLDHVSVLCNGINSTETSPTPYTFRHSPNVTDYQRGPLNLINLSSLNP